MKGGVILNAREKLNEFHLWVSLIIATIVAIATGSWLVFFVALAILLVVKRSNNDIRPTAWRRRSRGH